MIHGFKVNIGGTDYTVPPFNLTFSERCENLVKKAPKNAGLSDQMRLFNPLLVENLQRNYPDIDADSVSDNIDALNFRLMMSAVFGNDPDRPVPTVAPVN